MRVITGNARGRKLQAPEGLETRPSSDMTKQAVFNIIQNYVENATFLDLFAGSGQVGIEALSRGAKSVTFIDNDPKAIAAIKANLSACNMMQEARVAMMDSLTFLQNPSMEYEIAFLDPPYGLGLIDKALPLLTKCMAERGLILCEVQRDEELPKQVNDYILRKEYRYGKAKIGLFGVE